jgi:methylglyoxal/glyoxal reductase
MTSPATNRPFDLSRGLGSSVEIRPGVRMPVLGLGVWQLPEGRPTQVAVKAALDCGYRLIDTAALYGNERDVGEAVRSSGVPREEVFITTKLWNDDQGYDKALRAFERSRKALGVAVVDLYLIHWPVRGLREESWRALVELERKGAVRAIGVSNFTVPHLESLARSSPVTPAVDQVEFSPFLYQSELLEHARSHGVQLEAYSPLVRGQRLDHPTLAEIARAHGRTTAQVILRWDLERGVIPIPKSGHPERIRENAQIFDFELSSAELRTIDALNAGLRIGWNPTRFD